MNLVLSRIMSSYSTCMDAMSFFRDRRSVHSLVFFFFY